MGEVFFLFLGYNRLRKGVITMCLAIPHTIQEILDGNRAVARAGAVRTEIRTDLVDSPSVGDTVLVHAGFAIEKLSPADSEELLGLWDEVRRLAGEYETAEHRPEHAV